MQRDAGSPQWNPSGWLDRWGPGRPALEDDIDTDVAIIGGGFTGLSTSIAMRRLGHDVVVLERKHVGFGASGRNAGHVGPLIGHEPTKMAKMTEGRAVGALAKAAVEHLEKTISIHDIRCDYEPVGNLITAVNSKQSEKLAAWSRAADFLGWESELLEGSALRKRGVPPAFQRALLVSEGGTVNPAKLAVGLAEVAERAGAKLYEGTRVQRIEPGERILLHTPHGRVRANAVVLGANGFTEELGVTGRKIVMIQSQLLMTEPLTASQLDATGWHSRAAIITKHWTMESYRLTTDDRIVAGSKRVRYGYGGTPLPENASIHRLLERTFRERFPMLAGVEAACRWSGPMGLTPALLPLLSRTGKHRNVLCCGGYSGAGVPLAVYAGELLTDLWAGEGELAGPLMRKGIPFPPEPLSYLGANLVTAVMNGMDAAEDRRARKGS